MSRDLPKIPKSVREDAISDWISPNAYFTELSIPNLEMNREMIEALYENETKRLSNVGFFCGEVRESIEEQRIVYSPSNIDQRAKKYLRDHVRYSTNLSVQRGGCLFSRYSLRKSPKKKRKSPSRQQQSPSYTRRNHSKSPKRFASTFSSTRKRFSPLKYMSDVEMYFPESNDGVAAWASSLRQ